MSEIETGGRAFPWCGDLNETPSINLGLTVRDYMAAKAMQGFITGVEDFDEDALAAASYRLADAMLKARGEA
jgi:hypothetical protein